MIDHVVIAVSDLARSKRFYTAVLKPLGYRLMKETAASVGFGVPSNDGGSPETGWDFWIAQGAPQASLTHFAFGAVSRQAVGAFFEAAMQAGGLDNGQPGLRPRYHAHYYAAFALDPDGYNLEAVCHSAE